MASDDRQLLTLIAAVLDDTATEEERAELAEWLACDAEARRTYREYVNLHVALRVQATCQPGEEPPDAGLPRRRFRSLRLGLITFAAAAAVVFVIVIGLQRPRPDEPSFARLTRAAAARWAPGTPTPAVDEELGAGVLDLTEGLVELQFSCGATVILDAPAKLTLVDAMSARLHRGCLVAHVPPAARGFVVDTPQARVIDLGTEFGVNVRDGGATELQVYQGEVIARWGEATGQPADEHIKAGRAVQLDARDPAPQGIPFRPERFVRMFPSDRDGGQPGGPMYNRSRHETVPVMPAPAAISIDGNLGDWDRSGAFYSACMPPYHESHHVEGLMMYDEKFLYLAAHVGDPAPMRSVMNPLADPKQYAWRGGSVIVRLAADPALGWPLQGAGPALADTKHPDIGRRPQDVDEHIVHMTMWYHRPTEKPRLHLSHGLDFHGEKIDPTGWEGAFRVDPNGLGYTLEYRIPWSLLNAGVRPPRAGDTLAANWTVHWSDEQGELSRGHLVEITNLEIPVFRFLRGSHWGKAVFQPR